MRSSALLSQVAVNLLVRCSSHSSTGSPESRRILFYYCCVPNISAQGRALLRLLAGDANALTDIS